jgi:hypothetical protein
MNSINIAFQSELSYLIPEVPNHKDYAEFRSLIERIDEILKISALDLHFADEYVSNIIENCKAQGHKKELSWKEIQKLSKYAVQAYRCTLIGILQGKSYREQSVILAESPLLQKFCHIARIDKELKVPTKSTLQRSAKLCGEDFIREQIAYLNHLAFDDSNVFGFEVPVMTEDIFVDATCLKAKIHFPVDWVLLKDCMHTILQAILVIRKHGLKHRIKSPEIFISEINALCMSMTSSNRKPDGKKEHKKVFRKLKNIAKVIRQHAQRYADLLEAKREEKTDLSEAQAAQILQRLRKMIDTLPLAIEQANSRIISGKLIKNEEKLLSVYHENINVIKRGKAGTQIEFGNTLFLAEQNDGIIVDWKLYKTDVKEAQATRESVEKITEELEYEINTLTGDRGCKSKRNDKFLDHKKIYNALCPRNPHELVERIQEEKFRKLQTRRAQTEARIGIFKNAILDGSLYEKDFAGKEEKVAWAVLIHNLWVMARRPVKPQEISQVA